MNCVTSFSYFVVMLRHRFQHYCCFPLCFHKFLIVPHLCLYSHLVRLVFQLHFPFHSFPPETYLQGTNQTMESKGVPTLMIEHSTQTTSDPFFLPGLAYISVNTQSIKRYNKCEIVFRLFIILIIFLPQYSSNINA